MRCFKVSFDKNHESATGEMSDRAIALTGEALPANTFTRPYYRFTGWNTEPDGTGTSCADQGIFAPGANTTLYAQWEAKAKIVEEDPLDPDYAKLTLDGNGGTLSGTKTYWALKGVEIRADDLGPTSAERTNYTFKGWAGSSDGADPLPRVFDADATLYAQWEEDPSYTITFSLNGGTLNGKTGTVTYQCYEGTVITLPMPTRTGYTFDYWKGSRYNAGDSYTVNGAHTFTAQWKSSSASPKTGDNSHFGLWITLMGVSCIGLIGGSVLYKKKSRA